MKNKGFSLVELLAVLTLLGLLAILVTGPINKIVNNAKKDLNEQQKNQIVLAAQNWAIDNPYLLPPFIENKRETKVTIKELNDNSYFENDIINLINKNKLNVCFYVKITLNENTDSNQNVYHYEFIEEEAC